MSDRRSCLDCPSVGRRIVPALPTERSMRLRRVAPVGPGKGPPRQPKEWKHRGTWLLEQQVYPVASRHCRRYWPLRSANNNSPVQLPTGAGEPPLWPRHVLRASKIRWRPRFVRLAIEHQASYSHGFRSCGRVAEGGALLKRCTLTRYRRFESYRLRHLFCKMKSSACRMRRASRRRCVVYHCRCGRRARSRCHAGLASVTATCGSEGRP